MKGSFYCKAMNSKTKDISLAHNLKALIKEKEDSLHTTAIKAHVNKSSLHKHYE